MATTVIDASGLKHTARLAGRAAMDYIDLGQQARGCELPVVQSLDHIAEDLLALSSHLSLLAAALEHRNSRPGTRVANRNPAS